MRETLKTEVFISFKNTDFSGNLTEDSKIAQDLYEKKLITYPRTDSNYVNASMTDKLYQLCNVSVDFMKTDSYSPIVNAVINLGKSREALEYDIDGAVIKVNSLEKRKEIYDILMSFKSQEATDEGRESYYPVAVYCSKCLKDLTTVEK